MVAPEEDPAEGAELVGVDLEHPNPARMYDYYLGGAHNFGADRRAAETVLEMVPAMRTFARDNRSFLRRAVRYLVGEAGITQLLDLGSGIPTVGNTHEVAQEINPEARVVYVDHEPVAVQTASSMLAGNPNTAVIGADLRHTETVLAHPETTRLLDFTKPVAVLTVSVFPFIPDEDNPEGIIATYRDACPGGSYLALSHALSLDYMPEAAGDVMGVYDTTTHPLHLRSPERITAFFDGYEIVEPGVVFTAAWRPEQPVTAERARASYAMAAVGRFPGRQQP